MKTSFLTLLALLTICLATSDTNASTLPVLSTPLDNMHELNGDEGGLFKIKIHFERGRKNEQGICHDRGVCKLKIEISLLTSNPGGLNGGIEKDPNGNVLLILEKGGMTAEDAIDITGFAQGPGTLQLSNNSDVPTDVKNALGLSAQYQFQAGSYQVTETQTTYVVNFGR